MNINTIFPMNAPLFDLLVLAIVQREDAYGYEISQVIKQVSATKDSTLYPVLKRLQEQECLTTYDQPFQGRNRRYYKITDAGVRRLEELTGQWVSYRDAIERIVEGGIDCE